MIPIDRRAFLGSAAVGATLLAVGSPALLRPLTAGFAAVTEPRTGADPRVAALIELSRDDSGRPHVADAVFLSETGAHGSLAISPQERADLWHALATHDFATFRECGLRLGGRKFVFLREAEAGAVLHAVRRGEFLTVRASGQGLIAATSTAGMAHGRAVEAVYQYVRRAGSVTVA